jgi:hypothetical protein
VGRACLRHDRFRRHRSLACPAGQQVPGVRRLPPRVGRHRLASAGTGGAVDGCPATRARRRQPRRLDVLRAGTSRRPGRAERCARAGLRC